MFIRVTVVACLAFAASPLRAQAGVVAKNLHRLHGDAAFAAAPAMQIATPNSGGAFAVELLGGSLGSLAGIGIVGLAANCGNDDDLACVILKVGAGGALGAVGATIGTLVAARQTGSNRSVWGAALGSVVGTGVGLGVHYALNSASDRNLGDPVVVPIFVISQGTFAALGSRLVGAARSTR